MTPNRARFMFESRSIGPEPLTNTAPATGGLDVGTVRVPVKV
jgi:hypothetical protein